MATTKDLFVLRLWFHAKDLYELRNAWIFRVEKSGLSWNASCKRGSKAWRLIGVYAL